MAGAAGDVRDRVLTWPNALSVLRLVLVPVFLYLLLIADATGWAVGVLMFSGFSDDLRRSAVVDRVHADRA